MKTLLIIAHAPSNNTSQMAHATLEGAKSYETSTVNIHLKKPIDTQAEDIINASAIILGTTENLGYMAGLSKDLFDRCYYPCLEKTQGLAFALYIRAGHDGTGTCHAIESITKGLRWHRVQAPLICKGEFQEDFINQCHELGLTMAASLDAGII